MPKKKIEIQEKDVEVRFSIYKAASMSVLNAEQKYDLENAGYFPSVVERYKFSNIDAITQWSSDCVVAAHRIAHIETPTGWDVSASASRLLSCIPMGAMNAESIGYYYTKQLSRMNLWKKAPYCFVDQKSGKITAYFVGNKTLAMADSYAWQYRQIFRRSGASEQIQARAAVFSRHAAVCYYALTGEHYSKTWGTYPMQSAFAGENVGNETLQNICSLIVANSDEVALPDCWQILNK